MVLELVVVAACLVEITKRIYELSPSTSITRGEAGSVKRMSMASVIDSVYTIVACKIYARF